MTFYLLFYTLFHFGMPDYTYQVKPTLQPIQITGHGTDAQWQSANVLTDFTYPWREEQAPLTEFRAAYDEEYFYFLYRATDPDIITKSEDMGEMDVVNSDRVEIFFKKDDEMNPYYALELDALGRVLDTEGRFHREIDFEWQWPEGHLIVMASADDEGYWVEGKISFASLRQLGMYADDQILRAGLYRGEYVKNPTGETEVKWISWVKPDSSKPDFHIPSSFGILRLE